MWHISGWSFLWLVISLDDSFLSVCWVGWSMVHPRMMSLFLSRDHERSAKEWVTVVFSSPGPTIAHNGCNLINLFGYDNSRDNVIYM